MALTEVPLSLLNCSEREPFEGVYFAPMAINPSAKDLTAVVREANVGEEASYVPMVSEVLNCWKKPSEVEVIAREPWLFQTTSASYSCSATANVVRYHG